MANAPIKDVIIPAVSYLMWRPKSQIGVGDVHISPLAKKYIQKILETERVTYGTFIAAFEKEFAAAHNLRYAIFTNSGTSALQVALHALKITHHWQDGDEIIVPALTFVATVNIILQNNLRPIFVDVDPRYYDINPLCIQEQITSRTRAIIPVHIGGQPADMGPIVKLAKKNGLKIIEDSCETMFAKYHGQPVGTFGDIACFSTYAAHTLVTGVGGLICTNNHRLAILAKSLVNHGRDGIYIAIDDDQGKRKQDLFRIVGRRFKFTEVGYSYRATEFEGALGLAQMKDWRTFIKKRQKNAAQLSQGFADLSQFLQLPTIRPKSEHIFMFYPLIIKDRRVKRLQLIHFLEENLIETRYLLPLLNQPVYKKLFGNLENEYPEAKHIAHHGFYIGCHPGLDEQELNYIIYKMHEFFRKKRLVV